MDIIIWIILKMSWQEIEKSFSRIPGNADYEEYWETIAIRK